MVDYSPWDLKESDTAERIYFYIMPSEWVFNLCLNIFRESNYLPPRTTIIGARGTGFEAIYYLGSNAVSAT